MNATSDQPRRLLVTGSRDWENQPAVAAAIVKQWLDWGRPPLTLVHGAAKGLDTMAAKIVQQQAEVLPEMFTVEAHPAEWDVHGKAAGPIRNALMVSLGADAILAFIRNGSRGSTHCLGLAEQAGIPAIVYRLDDGETR